MLRFAIINQVQIDQRTLFETEQRSRDSVRRRLKSRWVEGFQGKVLPILPDAETDFAALYSDEAGRPNGSAARMLGIGVLQERLKLDDESALDSLSFDSRWQPARGLEPEDAYCRGARRWSFAAGSWLTIRR